MANVKFITTKGASTLTTSPFYIGVPQHERTMSKKETYEYLADKIGYKAAAIRAVFLALKQLVKTNAAKGCISQIDGVTSVRNTCRGSFDTSTGPWVKGRNYLQTISVELDPFKSTLKDVVPVNRTEGANPVINTVLDEVTGIYDVIVGTDAFTAAGSDLGPDTSATDEYVAIVSKTGTETVCTIDSSSLGAVKAHLNAALPAGDYTLAIYTRSGLGSEFGVKKATRKITIA